jgi:CubicO group peptidase (beta-lactamase class C family)
VDRVDRIMAEFARSDGPGCAVGVSRDGELLLAKGYGLANLDHGVPNGPDTVFDVGSVSKQFTAAAIRLLAEQGRLSLDDPLRLHVPELPDYGAPLTLRHLIHHTSGVRDYLELQGLAGMPAHDVYHLDDLLTLIARQRELNFTPGDQHLYSNSGYILLAIVAERVTGEPLGEFLRERIFEPLGMERSFVYDDPTRVIPGRATGYAPRPGGGYAVDHYYNFALPGDGQIYTTLGDLARWDRAFSRGGVGEPGFMQRLLEPGRLNDGTLLDYAFGLRLGEHRGLATIRHGGSWGGFRAHFLRYPGPNLAVSCLCNDARAEPEDLAEAVAGVFLEDAMQPVAEAASFQPSIVALEALSGTFREERTGEIWQLRLRRGSLHARTLDGGSEQRLTPLAPGRFDVGGEVRAQIRFEAGHDGRRQVRLQREGAAEVLLEEVDTVRPAAAALAAYAGSYFSDELDVSWMLAPSGPGLEVEMSRGGAGFAVWPSVPDVFLSDDRVLRFERDASGDVTGFRVHKGRVKNLHFTRRSS